MTQSKTTDANPERTVRGSIAIESGAQDYKSSLVVTDPANEYY
jgi:hypothetical protein